MALLNGASVIASSTHCYTKHNCAAELLTSILRRNPCGIASDSEAAILEAEGFVLPPNDLYSDEPPLETHLHLQQMRLMLKCLDWHWRDRSNYFTAGNLTVYYSPNQRKTEDFRRSDFFVVLGTDRRSRRSWMVWEEDGKYPNVIIELLSSSTADKAARVGCRSRDAVAFCESAIDSCTGKRD